MAPVSPPERWLAHTPMSDPGPAAALIEALPNDPPALVRAVQGLLLHGEWLGAYGLDADRTRPPSRTTLPVSERLARLLRADPKPLGEMRAPEHREVGTCRDFALMLCAFLRCKGAPARVRCGFAAYFGDGWEDHWVCEVWDAQRAAWRLCDAQMDEALQRACAASFDAADVPRPMFLTAGEAWAACRAGDIDPARCGHGEVVGAWFVKVNVWRDHLSVGARETSAWDDWRSAAPPQRIVRPDETGVLDRIAARPEQPVTAAAPDWLVKDGLA
jgi:hypothetical protein